MHWSSYPTTKKFLGCIANLTYNGMVRVFISKNIIGVFILRVNSSFMEWWIFGALQYYNLGEPSYAYNMNVTNCDSYLAGSVIGVGLGVDWNFIIVILVSVLVLLLLIMAFLFYRKRRSYEEVKGEFNDDVRDNILHYSDEGGGEGDQTGYDLSVLMNASKHGAPYLNPHMDKIAMDDLNRQGRGELTSQKSS